MNRIILNADFCNASARRIRLAQALAPLVCRWEPAGDGRGLACRWEAAAADPRKADEPVRRLGISRASLGSWRRLIARRKPSTGRVGRPQHPQAREARHG